MSGFPFLFFYFLAKPTVYKQWQFLPPIRWLRGRGGCVYFCVCVRVVFVCIAVHDIIPWGPVRRNHQHWHWALREQLQGDQHCKARSTRILPAIWECTQVCMYVSRRDRKSVKKEGMVWNRAAFITGAFAPPVVLCLNSSNIYWDIFAVWFFYVYSENFVKQHVKQWSISESSPPLGFGSGTRGSWRSQRCSGSQWRQSSRSLVCRRAPARRTGSCRWGSWRSLCYCLGPTTCEKYRTLIPFSRDTHAEASSSFNMSLFIILYDTHPPPPLQACALLSHYYYEVYVLYCIVMFPSPDRAFRHAWHRQGDIQGDLALSSEDAHHTQGLHLTAGSVDRRTSQIGQLAEHNAVLIWNRTDRAALWWWLISCKSRKNIVILWLIYSFYCFLCSVCNKKKTITKTTTTTKKVKFSYVRWTVGN